MTLYAIMKDGKSLREEEGGKPICVDTWTDNPLKVRLYRERRYAFAMLSRLSLGPGVSVVSMELGPPVPDTGSAHYAAKAAERQRLKAAKREARLLAWRLRRAEEKRKEADEELERLRKGPKK